MPQNDNKSKLQLTLEFIREFRKERNISPTYEEIAMAIYGSTSKRSAQLHLVQPLIESGYLYRNTTGAERTLMLTWKGKRKDVSELDVLTYSPGRQISKYSNRSGVSLRILELLKVQNGQRQVDLSKQLDVIDITPAINFLVREGLVERRDNPNDRRSYLIYLSQK